jgi:hypothetical protein
LILHRVRIHRNGKVLEKLNPAKIKIIQPETDLGDDVFTGEQSAVVFVEDLRVGDVLEYAYTTRGGNPVTGDHYAAQMIAQSGVPVDRQRIRVVWTAQKPLFMRINSVRVPMQEKAWNGGKEYQWDFEGLEEIPYEDDLPLDFNPYPSLEFTDFRDWAEVVNWALPLYAVEKTNAPTELEELIQKWRGEASDELRARKALEFVQDELRYTGIELGPDSYRPSHPFETFQLRYGDCKGKASLLCTILHELNIEAYPALVDSGGGMITGQCLPSPFAFDHAIVKIILDGKAVWVDATASNQGGTLWNRYVSHFGKALVIEPGVTNLETIPFPGPDNAQQETTSTYQLKDYSSPVSLTVKTVYRGGNADLDRRYFARSTIAEIQKNYLNFYSKLYPGVTAVKPIAVEDTRGANLRIVSEYYEIPNLWKTNASQYDMETTFSGDALFNQLSAPDVRVRKMPLRVTYPLKVEQHVIVHMPDNEWNLPQTNRNVEGDAFAFHSERTFDNGTVHYHYTLETKTNQLPAAKVAAYLKQRDEMNDDLDSVLYRKTHASGVGGVNWLMVVIVVFAWGATLVGCAAIWWLTRSRAVAGGVAEIPPMPGDAHLKGFGGWLILVGIRICLAPFLRIETVVTNWQGFFLQSSWQQVAVPTGANYHPLYGPLLIFEVLSNVALLGLNLLVIAMFFAKRKAFPKIYVSLLLANLVCVVIDEIVGNLIPSLKEISSPTSSAQLFQVGVGTIIWWAYMVKSRRVRATFVN